MPHARVVAALLAGPVACPYGNMPRSAGAGHWRDWHRGHGCHLDPQPTKEMTMLKPLAVEFTLSLKTALSISAGDPGPYASAPGRFRVIVPSASNCSASSEVVAAYYQHKNEIGETVWSPMANCGLTVGHVSVYQRLVITLAFHGLLHALAVTTGTRDGLHSLIRELDNGAHVIDLGEI